MEYIQYIVSILTGLTVVIPLILKLIEYVQKASKERNWNKLVSMVIELMETAENKLEKGADKKEWVMAMVKSSADTINYDVDMDRVGTLIDDLCEMSKVVNGPKAPDNQKAFETKAK